MPSSRPDAIPFVVDLIMQYQPKTILDVGVGMGRWGVLFREYLDVWKVDKPYNQRVTEITGIEVFAEYDNPVWQVYDKVIVDNVMNVIPQLSKNRYDLLFMADVIEHFPKFDAQRLLRELFFKHLIIITPLNVSAQQSVYNNEFETHVSEWKHQDFPKLECKLIGNQQVFFG